MAGTHQFGTGPAVVLYPESVNGTHYSNSEGPPEYRIGGQWVPVCLGPAGGPELAEEFLGPAGTTLPAPLAKQITGATPTGDYVNNAPGGTYALSLDTTNEVESATLYQGDQLTFGIGKKPIVEMRLKLEPDVTGAGGELATGDVIVFGLASARNADPDLITTHAWFRLQGDGSNKNILVETDDGTTDTDDQDTGSDWVADTFYTFAIDASDLTNVRFLIDGVQVQPVLMDMSQASGNLQLYIEVAKAAAANNDHRVTVDYVRVRATER